MFTIQKKNNNQCLRQIDFSNFRLEMTNRQHIIAHTISIIIIMSDDEIALFDRTNDSKWFKWNWMTQRKIRSMRTFSQPIFIMKQFCGARTLFINRSNAMGNFYISSHFLCELNSRRCFFVYFVKTKTEYVRCCCQRHSQTLIVLTVRSKWMVRVLWIAKNSSYIITRNFVFSFGLLVGWLLLRFFFLALRWLWWCCVYERAFVSFFLYHFDCICGRLVHIDGNWMAIDS